MKRIPKELLLFLLAGNESLMSTLDMPHCRLPPRLNLILPSSGLLRSVRWFETDVSGLPTEPTFKSQDVFLDILTLEDRSDR
jgi:hypothetical protein